MGRITEVTSGGQSGVDRAALDAALQLDVPCGGWCPQGRRAEDGTIARRYPLRETPGADYGQRTRWNVRDSDATLILGWGVPKGGTLLTLKVCRESGKPHLLVDLSDETYAERALQAVGRWLAGLPRDVVLNVAGPRGSEHPALYERARAFVLAVLANKEYIADL